MRATITDGFSIVLCTHNGEERLPPTLKHLAALIVPEGYRVELILVNNASTDNTVAFVRTTWELLGFPFELKVLDEHRPGKGYAVESGYDAANYSNILTVDDDNWLQDDYLLQAKALFEMDVQIGVLQGHSTGIFENEPPAWLHENHLEHFFVIGGPIEQPGYYPQNNYGAWGAGMIMKTRDWRYLRSLGFAFLTSKIPGKAAGEDHELAIALLIMGRKIYYSDKLRYSHYMPAARVTWEKLQQNFEIYGYVSHYNFLYALVIEAYEKKQLLNNNLVSKEFLKFFCRSIKSFTLKQHLAYHIKPMPLYYQLRLRQYFSHYRWFFRLMKNAKADIRFLQSWLVPLLQQHPGNFSWPGKVY